MPEETFGMSAKSQTFPKIWFIAMIAGFGLLLIAIVGMTAYFYLHASPAVTKKTSAMTNAATSSQSLHWMPVSTLFKADLGYSVAANGDLLFNNTEEQTRVTAATLQVAQFGKTLSLPTYARADTSSTTPHIYYLSREKGIVGPLTTSSTSTFTPLIASKTDRSCGYRCTYDAINTTK